MRIAIISDTHGLLRPEVEAFVQGSDLIFHAGDIGKEEVLEKLRACAPVQVVRGNVDTESWAHQLPSEVSRSFSDPTFRVFMTHKWQDVPEDVHDGHASLIIIGHSHKPDLAMQAKGTLKLNPGSCGPRRFNLPVCAALMVANADQVQIKILNILTQEQLFEWNGKFDQAF